MDMARPAYGHAYDILWQPAGQLVPLSLARLRQTSARLPRRIALLCVWRLPISPEQPFMPSVFALLSLAGVMILLLSHRVSPLGIAAQQQPPRPIRCALVTSPVKPSRLSLASSHMAVPANQSFPKPSEPSDARSRRRPETRGSLPLPLRRLGLSQADLESAHGRGRRRGRPETGGLACCTKYPALYTVYSYSWCRRGGKTVSSTEVLAYCLCNGPPVAGSHGQRPIPTPWPWETPF